MTVELSFERNSEVVGDERSRSGHNEWLTIPKDLGTLPPRSVENGGAGLPLEKLPFWRQNDFVSPCGVEIFLFFLDDRKEAWVPLQDLLLSLNGRDCL